MRADDSASHGFGSHLGHILSLLVTDHSAPVSHDIIVFHRRPGLNPSVLSFAYTFGFKSPLAPVPMLRLSSSYVVHHSF
jgi:hypothetical protein